MLGCMMPRGKAVRDKNIYCAYGILKTKKILFESLKDREKHLEVQIGRDSSSSQLTVIVIIVQFLSQR